MKKHLLLSLFALAGLGVSQVTSAVTVGGVSFGTPGTSHLETTTIAETFITGVGQTLRGYGQINTVNGDFMYGTNPSNRLYFVFDQYVSQSFTTTLASFFGGEVRVYLAPTTRNLLNFSSEDNFTWIETLTPWLKLVGHDLDGAGAGTSTLDATGPNNAFVGSGDLDVVRGWGDASVAAFMDSNGIFDLSGVTKTDMRFNSSGSTDVPNTNDSCDLQAGQWCVQGSADLRGLTVPEPSALALLGLGLLGVGFSSRKRKSV